MTNKLNLIVETYQIEVERDEAGYPISFSHELNPCPKFAAARQELIDQGIQAEERRHRLTKKFSPEKLVEEKWKSSERNAAAKGFTWRARLVDADKQPGDEGYIVFECRKACQTRGTADRKGHQFLKRYLKHGDFNVPVTMLQPAVAKPKG